MEAFVVFAVLIVIGYAATKSEDKRIVARGEELAAPEWARWLLILLVAVIAPFMFGALLMGLAEIGALVK